MCFIVEIGMMVFGIITLVKGRFWLSRTKVVTGAPAYVIGGLLTATLPTLFGIGVIIGLLAVAQGGRPPDIAAAGEAAAVFELFLVLAMLVTVLIIAAATAKRPEPPSVERPLDVGPPISFPPADPNNPYAPPHAQDDRKSQERAGSGTD